MAKKKENLRDLPTLTHVETRKQQVDQNKIAKLLAEQQKLEDQKQQNLGVSGDEKSILTAFEKDRMLLDRIWIIVNQSRTMMGLDPYKRDLLKAKLDELVEKDLLSHQQVEYDRQVNDVYILTDLGKDYIL